MADELADLSLVISGDIGPVEQALNQLPDVAQTAAQNIDAALGTIADESAGATQGLANLSDALSGMWQGDWAGEAQNFDAALQGVGDAAGGAAPKLDELGDGAKHAGEGASEAGSMFGELGEQLIHVLEKLGLMITAWEALKEVMQAAAAEQSFLVSMEALTHSAETAQSALEDMDRTALEIPVAFESLLSATQKLTAFGVTMEQIPELLHAAADAAAATGNSFDSVVAGLERVEVTGQVMARSLVQMGITWKQVADEMGVSVEQAQAAFKKGAQSAEEDVSILVQTMEKNFAGLGERMATTLGGAWQIFKNQLTELADSAGQILAPLATGLMAALAPIIDILGGLLKVIAQVFQALGQLGPVAATAAEALGVLGLALTGLAVALDLITGPVGIVLGLVSLLTLGFGTESDAAREATERATQLKEEQEKLNTAFQAAQTDLSRYGISMDQAGKSTEAFRKSVIDTDDAVKHFEASLQAMPGLENLKKAAIDTSLLGDAMHGDVGAAIQFHDALTTAASAHDALVQKVNAAKIALDAEAALVRQGKADQGELNTAQEKYNSLLEQLNGKLATHTKLSADDKAAIAEQAKYAADLAAQMESAQMAMIGAAEQSVILGNSFGEFARNVQLTQTHFDAITSSLLSQQAALDQAKDAYDHLNKSQQDMLANEKADLDAAQEALNVRFQEAAEADIAAAAAKFYTDQITSAAQQAKTTADVMKQVWTDVLAPEQAAEEEAARIDKGLQALGVSAKHMQANFQDAFDAFNALLAGGNDLERLHLAAEQLATSIAKTADQQQRVVDLLERTHQPMQIQLDAQAKLVSLKMQDAQYTDMTGESELRLSMTLSGIQLQQFAIHQQTMGLADLWNSVAQAAKTAWDGIAQGIAQALVEGRNFGDVMTQIFNKLAETILTAVIKKAMNDMLASIITNTTALQWLGVTSTATQTQVAASMAASAASMASSAAAMAASLSGATAAVDASLAGMTTSGTAALSAMAAAMAGGAVAVDGSLGTMAGAAVAASTTASGALGTFAGAATSSMATASTAVVAAGTTMIATFNLIAGAISAIAGIFSAIELMHTNTLLSRIEESTRRLDITTETGIMPAVEHLPDFLQMISNTLDGIHSDTFNSMTLLGYIATDVHGMNAAILAGGFAGGGGGGGTQGMTAQIADALASMDLMIRSLQNQIGYSGTGTPIPTVILGGGGGTSSYAPGVGSGVLPGGSGGVYVPVVGSGSSGITVNAPVTVQGSVVGAGGMQQLSQMVGQQIVQSFRGAGMKI